MVAELLRKYIWLVQTFIKAGNNGLSLDEIIRKWENYWYSDYSRRTFNNHREVIEEFFGIRIECNRSTRRYFIRYSEDVKDENAEAAWLINTFTVNNLLSLSKERLTGRVSVENIPSGQKYLTILIDVMSDNLEIEITYRKYTGTKEEHFKIRPYGIKELAKRWYLVGYCYERDSVRVYGLDRISLINVTDKKFDLPEQFNIDELFSSSFGVYLPGNNKAVDILFISTVKEAEYLKDLPLHHSQQIIEENSESVVFKIKVVPNEHLIMELCKRGDRIKVLEPKEVRDNVANTLKTAAALYE